MDPAGVKFGLSRNLLQLDGADIIIAADLLDALSDLARHQMVTGSPRFGTDFLHLLLADGIRQVLPPRVLEKDVEEELDSFCKGIGGVLDDTLITLAVRAHIGHRLGSTFLATERFMGDLEDNALDATREADDNHRRFFEVCRATVTVYFARHDLASTKHADLLTLFLVNKWIGPMDSLKKFFFPS
jgi:hypothetical protein